MTSIEWLGMVPAARRLVISVRELYGAVDQGRVEARWVSDPLLRLEVAVGEAPPGAPTAGVG